MLIWSALYYIMLFHIVVSNHTILYNSSNWMKNLKTNNREDKSERNLQRSEPNSWLDQDNGLADDRMTAISTGS